MDIMIVFEWFAQESAFAAELTHEQSQREIWTRLALLWSLAAAQCRQEEAGTIGEDAACSAAMDLKPPQSKGRRATSR